MVQQELVFPERRGRQRIPLEKRFWSKVDKNGPVPPHVPQLGPCWVWTAAVNTAGYGVLSKGGEQRAALHLAHRVSWELHNGSIPSNEGYHGNCVCHRCDNRRCVRPDHLLLGTQADNVADRDAKGRRDGSGCKPNRAPKRKRRLRPAQVREIRARLDAGESRASVAVRFGITTTMVGYIVQGRYWSRVA